jgi:hypothetical protein
LVEKRGLIEGLADIPRFRELNVTAEMSPAMHFTTQFPPPNLGYNFSGLVEAENLVTVGSDWAFGMTLPLFPSVAHLVEEIGADRVIEMLTINGVRSVARDTVNMHPKSPRWFRLLIEVALAIWHYYCR